MCFGLEVADDCAGVAHGELDVGFFETLRGAGEFTGEAGVEQVEAISELDDGSDDCGAFDFAAFASSLSFPARTASAMLLSQPW